MRRLLSNITLHSVIVAVYNRRQMGKGITMDLALDIAEVPGSIRAIFTIRRAGSIV